jgi:nitroreductase
MNLDDAIKQRYSSRNFLPKPVPRGLLDEALVLAQRAPSNSNIQPWHVTFVSGTARDRLSAALLAEAKKKPPQGTMSLPEQFQKNRFELGAQIYGAMGVGRDDKAGRMAYVLRNWEFFHAPVAGFVFLHKDLGLPDAAGVGMFLQNFLLALTERGIGSCIQVSLAGYPDIVRSQLSVPAELKLLCGMSIGYADPDYPMNTVRAPRQPIQNNVKFIDM